MILRIPLLALLLTVLAVPAAAANRYDTCLARTQGDPAGALEDATAWAKTGGGPAAEHCAALALVGLRRYSEAAVKLDTLARGAPEPGRKSALFDQAGNAWMLAGRADSAVVSFTAALGIDAFDTDLLADRARALAMSRNWAKAESDLTAALLVSPDRADLYVLRGSARHAIGRRAEARADFDRALKLQPGNAEALVERGEMKFETGDAAGARADWQAAATAAPQSAAAGVARQHLADTAR